MPPRNKLSQTPLQSMATAELCSVTHSYPAVPPGREPSSGGKFEGRTPYSNHPEGHQAFVTEKSTKDPNTARICVPRCKNGGDMPTVMSLFECASKFECLWRRSINSGEYVVRVISFLASPAIPGGLGAHCQRKSQEA